MDGWTFPRDLMKVPSDAVTLRSRMAIEDDRIIIEIRGEQGSSEVSVTQSGTALSVASVGSAPLRS